MSNLSDLFLMLKGGKGSGNWGHAGGVGGKGNRGGSAPKSGVGAAMSLRTGPTAEKRRLEAKGVTNQQKVPAGTPVSSALNLDKLPIKGKLAPDVRETIDIIDKVHGDGDLPNTDIMLNNSKSNFGQYVNRLVYKKVDGKYQRVDENYITVSRNTTHPMMTTAHEVGHLIDYKGMGAKRGSPPFGPASELVDTIKNSKGYKNLRELKNSNKEIQTKYVGADGKEHNLTYKPDRKYINYLERSDESFARAYSQYVAVKSKNPKMKSELDALRKSDNYKTQWDDDDFKPIEKAFDDMFAERGWIK